jgi:ribosome-associated toxin RatA of RatAB toxin-antitoxin module
VAQVNRTVLVEHSAQQMFRLVDDVAAYPQFLPWCRAADVSLQTDALTEAAIQIDYHHLKQRFSTRNEKRFPERMDIRLLQGPFRRLQGHWHFVPLGEHACKIEFALEYEFSSKLVDKLVGPVFGYIANSLVDAFIKRADALATRDSSST